MTRFTWVSFRVDLSEPLNPSTMKISPSLTSPEMKFNSGLVPKIAFDDGVDGKDESDGREAKWSPVLPSGAKSLRLRM
ncbi:hypothetical protein B296_00020395 [Ensete ventricosum]|uniref:Uncharacterized protein n=1 Tax=Ensete ventricosum TaxID=4639 RepID=A0A426YLM5_ENSVE|nr:hypothetical protein B296_00020395 [Ensete ventricosum]